MTKSNLLSKWLSGWQTLTFQEKHSVVFSLSGVAATVVFGALAALLGWAQVSFARTAAEKQRNDEIRARNQRELRQASDWFASPRPDDHDDMLRMLEDHVLKHVGEQLRNR